MFGADRNARASYYDFNSLLKYLQPLSPSPPSTLANLLVQATVALTTLTSTLGPARPLVAVDVVTLTNFLTQMARNVILQASSSPHDPTDLALANFLNTVVSSLCPAPAACAPLVVTAPTNSALMDFATSASLGSQTVAGHNGLANFINQATIALATSVALQPGGGLANFFNVMAANINRVNHHHSANRILANFLTQLAVTVAV